MIPHKKRTISTLMPSVHGKREIHMAKQIHQFVLVSSNDNESINAPTGYEKEKVRTTFETFYSACALCSASGRPVDRKIYIYHLGQFLL